MVKTVIQVIWREWWWWWWWWWWLEAVYVQISHAGNLTVAAVLALVVAGSVK